MSPRSPFPCSRNRHRHHQAVPRGAGPSPAPGRALTVVQRAPALPGQSLLDLPLDAQHLLLPGPAARELEPGLGGQSQAGAVQLPQDLLAQHGADVALLGGGAAVGHGHSRARRGSAPITCCASAAAGSPAPGLSRRGPGRAAPSAQHHPGLCPARRTGARHGPHPRPARRGRPGRGRAGPGLPLPALPVSAPPRPFPPG